MLVETGNNGDIALVYVQYPQVLLQYGTSRILTRLGAGVKTYTTVGTVCPSALLGGLVDLDVLDNQSTSVETLGIGVGLSVLEEVEDVLGGLDGPAGSGDTELLAYSTTKSANHMFRNRQISRAIFVSSSITLCNRF